MASSQQYFQGAAPEQGASAYGAVSYDAPADEATEPAVSFTTWRISRVGFIAGLVLSPAVIQLSLRSRRSARDAATSLATQAAEVAEAAAVAPASESHPYNVSADPGQDDDYEEPWFHNFGKWTLTTMSHATAETNKEAAWYGMNQITLKRNESEPLTNYPLVGPTGCDDLTRAWTAERYLVGDNEIHWVYDESGNNPIGNISVKEQHTMVRKLHGDLSEFDQFMDFMMTSYVPNIDPYIKAAKSLKEKYDFEYKFIKGVTPSVDVPLYSVLLENLDGQIFEFMSIALYDSDSESAFVEDECWFRPVGDFPDQTWYTDYTFEDLDLAKLGNFLNVDQYARDYNQSFSSPAITHIASTDPATDANFLLKYLGGENIASLSGTTTERAHKKGAAQDVTHLESEAGVSTEKCSMYKSRWLMFNGDDFEHYLHLAWHPEAKAGEMKGESFGLKDWEAYLADIRKDMNDNVYDVFMDDHVGMEAWSTTDYNSELFASIATQMAADGVPLLTRREPYPGEPRKYFLSGTEKFSFFFKLPTSQWPFQMQLPECTMDTLESYGLPKFCDWDFCPGFVNYRDDGAKLTTSATCGFGSNYTKPTANADQHVDDAQVDAGHDQDDAYRQALGGQ